MKFLLKKIRLRLRLQLQARKILKFLLFWYSLITGFDFQKKTSKKIFSDDFILKNIFLIHFKIIGAPLQRIKN